MSSGGCEKVPVSQADIKKAFGESAQEACTRVSTEAEKIKAHYDGAANAASAWQGFLNPRNYAAGDNTVDNFTRNIVNNSLTTCDQTDVKNICKNSIEASQKNIIDNTKCSICNPPGGISDIENQIQSDLIMNVCKLENVTQKNLVDVEQDCFINASIEKLLSKKDSVKAQAMAKVLQESKGLLSGDNKTGIESCNFTDNSVTSDTYINMLNECSNEMNVGNLNNLEFCGSIVGVSQDNAFEAVQKCTSAISEKLEKKTETETTNENKTESDQKSEGADLAALLSSLIPIIIIVSSIFGLVGGLSQGAIKPGSRISIILTIVIIALIVGYIIYIINEKKKDDAEKDKNEKK